MFANKIDGVTKSTKRILKLVTDISESVCALGEYKKCIFTLFHQLLCHLSKLFMFYSQQISGYLSHRAM